MSRSHVGRKLRLGWIFWVTFLLIAARPEAKADLVDFQTSGPNFWGILAVGNTGYSAFGDTDTKIHINGPGMGVYGSATQTNSGVAASGGIVLDAVPLAQAANDAAAAVAALNSLECTMGGLCGLSLTAPMTITGGAGVNVLTVDSIKLDKETVTLSAPAGAMFILIDPGEFVLSKASILLSGGITPSGVVYFASGTNKTGGAVSVGGKDGGAVLEGILVSPMRDVQLSGAAIHGEVIGGGAKITLASGASVQTVPQVPEPGTVVLFGVGMIVAGMAARHGLRSRKRLDG